MAAEKIRLHDDGTVTLPWQGQSVRLRRPGLDTYRALRIGLAEMPKTVQAAVEDGTDPEAAAEDAMIAWWRLCFARLAPADFALSDNLDDWPTWSVYGQGAIPALVEHWRSVPLDHGAPVTTAAL